jgi:hypothetical protein
VNSRLRFARNFIFNRKLSVPKLATSPSAKTLVARLPQNRIKKEQIRKLHMKKIIFSLLFLLLALNIYSQELTEVCEKTIKVTALSEEVFYYGFAENDKIIFSLEEVNGKEIKEVEILEYPESSKFSDFKAKKIENKQIQVTKKNIYKFRIYNSSLGGRVCKIKIQRIPANEKTKNFNTTINWIEKQETTYNTYTKDVTVGYETKYETKVKKELIKVDTLLTQLFDKNLRVHSEMASGKTQYTYATIELPVNSYLPNQLNPYKTTEVVSWSYWLGVGQKSKEEYESVNKKFSSGITTLGALSGYGALASLAVTGISMFKNTNIGDNVNYKFYGIQNGKELIIDYGNVVSASGRNDKITQGSFSVQLFNDNIMDGIDVNLKMIVMQIQKTYQDIQYQEKIEIPKIEKQTFKEPIVTTISVPVMVE